LESRLRTVEGKFFHLEALDDRSRPNDWNIRAHAHADLNHVFHITSGGGVMHAEDQIAFAAPCLLLVPSGVVHGFAWEVETAGSVLTLADSYLRDLTTREPDFSSLFKVPCQCPGGSRRAWAAALEACRASWSGPRPAAAPRWKPICWRSWSRPAAVDPRQGRRPGHPRRPGPLVARFRELVEATIASLTDRGYAGGWASRSLAVAGCLPESRGRHPLRLVQDRRSWRPSGRCSTRT
jgi:AraC family transcriptional activator of pobA